MNDYTTSQQREAERFAYFSHVDASQSEVFSFRYHSHYIFFLSMPVRSAAVWFASLVRFKTMSCFRSPALNAGHGFTFFRCDTFS